VANNTSSYYGSDTASLIDQIVAQSGGDTTLEAALLWGAQGESGQIGTAGTPSAGGFFGFTPPSAYGLSWAQAQEAGPAVAAILPHYQEAETQAPNTLSGLALAEWIAIGGESPAFDSQEQAQIAQTGMPLTSDPYHWPGGDYGGTYVAANNFTYGENTDPTIGSVVSKEAAQIGAGQFTAGGIPAQGNPANAETPAGAAQLAKSESARAAGSPSGSSTAIGQAIDAQMNPKLTLESTTKNGSTGGGWSWDPITDLEHIYDDASSGLAAIPNDLDRLATNAWKIILASLIRVGLVILGLALVAAGIYFLMPQQVQSGLEMAAIA
jgi:hypothetical protein